MFISLHITETEILIPRLFLTINLLHHFYFCVDWMSYFTKANVVFMEFLLYLTELWSTSIRTSAKEQGNPYCSIGYTDFRWYYDICNMKHKTVIIHILLGNHKWHAQNAWNTKKTKRILKIWEHTFIKVQTMNNWWN